MKDVRCSGTLENKEERIIETLCHTVISSDIFPTVSIAIRGGRDCGTDADETLQLVWTQM